MRILGIDYGLAKIGLAESEEGLARPLIVMANSSKSIEKIVKICQEKKIEKIVVGLPEKELGEKTKEFVGKLFLRLQIPFEFQDETLTSKQALAKMIEGGKRKKIRQKMEDAFAAACLLQEYLEERRENV